MLDSSNGSTPALVVEDLVTEDLVTEDLVIEDLRASVAGRKILKGVDLTIKAGEVHAVMGPNGSGKSTLAHVIAGREGYEVLGGSVRLNGIELLGLPTWQRANAGLFLAMQYPVEVPGVSLNDMLVASAATTDDDLHAALLSEASKIGLEERFIYQPVNVDMSGGEKKRNEALQLAVLDPRFAIVDELDSGLDVDGLRMVAGRIEEATQTSGLGVLAITHYSRVFERLQPDQVHIFAGGKIQASGGPELADQLERDGYDQWVEQIDDSNTDDLFTDPFGDPFADQFLKE